MPHAQSPTPEPQPTINGVPLHVNDDLLSPDDVEFLHISYADEPMEVLRKRYDEDGYVIIRGLLPREDILSARESYFKAMAPSGVLQSGTAPVDGIFDAEHASAADYPGIGAGAVKGNSRPGETDTSAMFVDLALEQHTADWYIGSEDGKVPGLCNHDKLYEFVSKFSGWGKDTLGVKRSLLRNNTPGNKAIGVHYDQTFMRYGEPTSVTAWVPIGDISLRGGGLIYLKDGPYLQLEKKIASIPWLTCCCRPSPRRGNRSRVHPQSKRSWSNRRRNPQCFQ